MPYKVFTACSYLTRTFCIWIGRHLHSYTKVHSPSLNNYSLYMNRQDDMIKKSKLHNKITSLLYVSNMQVWTDVYVIEKICTSVYVYMYAQYAHIYKYICRHIFMGKKNLLGKFTKMFSPSTFHSENITSRILRHKEIIIYMYNWKQHSLCKDFQQKLLNCLYISQPKNDEVYLNFIAKKDRSITRFRKTAQVFFTKQD